ncbi:MAG TPA: adenylosuccinate lyase [Cyclobacteriaceae bacterium]|nr:adenylosuccinate lyase [Cyclobacteriaceae bacterium]
MSENELTSISPVDGRYRKITESLAEYFSEFALFKYRVRVELEYFIFLSTLSLPEFPALKKDELNMLRSIAGNFSMEDAGRIKEIEKNTNHDVKAVEYFLKEKLAHTSLGPYREFLHFGLTSQDINNTAIPLLLKDGMEKVILPSIHVLAGKLGGFSVQWKSVVMLARTHGQPASPTLLGRELAVFHERLKSQMELLMAVPYSAKFGGATGGMNAHYAAYPDIDWDSFSDELVRSFGLKRSKPTTQIEHYDNLAALFDALKRINTIFIDFCRDIWHYISIEYFTQKISENEVGSSTMPHKVNPIDFENAEGNLGYANAILEFFSAKLPVSRLQRDLTDSTVLRNIGIPLAHSYIAYQSLLRGLGKLELNAGKLQADLEDNWAIISEGIQTILRKSGYPEPYEALKKLTRNHQKITREMIHKFIDELDIDPKTRGELKKLSPFNYIGRA